jgi:hypothetical protein
MVLVLAVYSYPSFKTRAELGSRELPPILAPDLTLYLNLSNLTPLSEGQVENPYYRIPVRRNGAGYLKFGLAASLFGDLDLAFGGRTWLALFIWNAFWWGCLCVTAICVFERFLPAGSQELVVLGAALLMLFNFGVAKTVILAWVHLPSLAAFMNTGLPFMRAFIPIIPCVLLLVYLGLQMEALRRRRIVLWVAMAFLQLLALAVFPYATLLMAGITAVSIFGQPIKLRAIETWSIPLIYTIICTVLDCGFLLHGALGFYENRSSAIHLQPQLLPHLIGGNWALILVLTLAVAFSKTLPSEVKWPLVGLGTSNALLMLGDVVVPATRILLSHHAGHFVHTTVAVLVTFAAATVFTSYRNRASWQARAFVALFSLLLLVNGVFLAAGTYQAFRGVNHDVAELSNLRRSWNPSVGDLVIARSKVVDDTCGWIPLISASPVLFCTDAEVMLSPQQDRDVHRFRQALYLYFIGEDSSSLQRGLSTTDPSPLMYRLGYWAEAVSQSAEERKQGVRQIQADLIPLLQKVEERDGEASTFFHGYSRIVVIDKSQDPTFVRERLGSFLQLERQRDFEDLVISFYKPK